MKKAIILFSAIAVFMATGCIKEEFPASGFLTSDQLENYSIELMINGIAVDMMAAETSGYGDHTDFGIPAIHLKTDYMLADIVSLGNSNFNQFNYFIACLAMGADYGNSGYFWDSYYSWIKDANEIIARIDADTEDASEKEWLAQAYVYRAMCYLDLARLYIPKTNDYINVFGTIRGLTVPIVTEKTTIEKAQNNPRATRQDMYDFIVSDLEKAVSLFGTNTAVNYLRPSLAAAYGLLARAYLEIGTDKQEAQETDSDKAYQLAINYADLAINTSGKTPLAQAQWEDPVNGFNNGSSNNSWIWGLSLVAPSTANVMSFTAHISAEANWAYGNRVIPGVSRTFFQQISDSDFRKHSWLSQNWRTSGYDYQFSGNEQEKEAFKSTIAAPYVSLKFRPAMGEVNNFTVGSCADHPLMRVEEMYFIKMEAQAKMDGNITNAVPLLEDFLNTYRYVDGSYDCEATNLSEFYEEMLFQKRVEFWGEGIVMYDHKRLDIGFTRTGSNFVSAFVYDVEGRSPQWNIVIPRSEIQANPALEGYNNPDPTGFWY